MKKTYFIKTFNIILNLNILILFETVFFFLFKFLVFNFEKNSALQNCSIILEAKKWILQLSYYCESLEKITLIFVVLLLFVELFLRLRKDSILNYFKSVFQTFKLRNFLAQSERSEKTVENQNVTSYNPIFKDFNKAVHKCVIDVRNERMIVFIKVPHTQQAQKLLKDMEAQIKEEISSRNLDYYFSAPHRVKNKMWLIGTKR